MPAAPRRCRIGACPVDALDGAAALARVVALARAPGGGTVFTPNADHVVRAAHDDAFRAAYGRCAVALCDGMPVLWAARLLRTPLPEKLSGSRFLGPLLEAAAGAGLRVYAVGGRPGSSARLAAARPHLQLVGHSPPSRALEADAAALPAAEQALARLRPDLVLVSLSAPRQEIWADAAQRRLGRGAFVCTGSAVDIVAGLQPMPPAWLSARGLEWAWRLAREPRRLGRRYLLDDPEFFAIVWRQWRAQRRRPA